MCQKLSRTILSVVILSLSLVQFGHAADKILSGKEEKELFQKLNTLWKQRRTEIKTAEIRYRLFRHETTPMSRADFNALVDGLDLARNPDAMRELIGRIHVHPINEKQPWTIAYLYKSGRKLKEILGGESVQLVDGGTKIIYDPKNHYAEFANTAQSRMGQADISDFRLTPMENITGCRIPTGPRDGVVKIIARDGFSEAWWNVDNGTCQRYLLRAASGAVVTEHRELGFKLYPKGIRFPKVAIEARYSEQTGMLHIVRLSVIEEARFNRPISRDTFKVKTASPINVRDTRDPTGYVRTALDLPPTNDLQETFDSPKESPPTQGSTWIVIGALAIGSAMFIAGLLLLRKRSRSKM